MSAPQMKLALFFALVLTLWVTAPILSCLVGPVSASPVEAFQALAAWVGIGGQTDDNLEIVIVEIRLGRAMLALLCGGGLAAAGAALQGVLRNPLADPYILGVSAGAACGASLAIIFAAAFAGIAQATLISVFSLFGAIFAAGGALLLGSRAGAGGRENLILAGIAVATFLSAIVALIKALNEESVASIVFWLMGSLQGRGWNSIPLALCTFIPGALLIFPAWRKLDVLAADELLTRTMGLNPKVERLLIIVGACCMTAGCVAACGIIGFVGLVAPHIFRLMLGGAHGPLLLASFLGGGLFLLIADCLGRVILSGGQELPAGVITSLAGAPFFAFLIWKR